MTRTKIRHERTDFPTVGQKPDAHFGPRVPDSSPIRLRFGTPGRTFRPIPLFIRLVRPQ